jgi:hypothetical protein
MGAGVEPCVVSAGGYAGSMVGAILATALVMFFMR